MRVHLYTFIRNLSLSKQANQVPVLKFHEFRGLIEAKFKFLKKLTKSLENAGSIGSREFFRLAVCENKIKNCIRLEIYKHLAALIISKRLPCGGATRDHKDYAVRRAIKGEFLPQGLFTTYSLTKFE